MTDISRSEAREYYDDFSLEVGLRDWLCPNRRHEALKILIGQQLNNRRDLRILDVGCGAGVLAFHLKRYGSVTAIDFSGPAIAAARRIAPGIEFHVGSLEDLPGSDRFDVITMFDVLEQNPVSGHGALFDLRGKAPKVDS